jgi:hypothetical protein
MSHTVIRKVNNHTFDVFYGQQGWEDWARFHVENNRLHVVQCPKQLPPNVMNEVRTKLTKPGYLRRGK